MKTIFVILIFCSLCVKSQTYIRINGAGSKVNINTQANTSVVMINPFWVDSLIVDDDGYYNGFPMVVNARGFETVGIFKKSSGHSTAGPLTLVKTSNGGRTWTKNAITVNGVEISSTNHSFCRTSNGRMLICYREGGVIKFAYSDNGTHVFTLSQTFTLADTYQSPVKMVQMPSGNVLISFYKYIISGSPSEGILWEGTNNGTTWAYKSTIYSHSSAVSNPTLGDWRANEVAIAITHNTGIDATTKMIALARTQVADIGGTYPQHFFSSDGGATWATVTTGDAGSFVDDNGVTITNNNPGLSRHLLYSFIGTNSPFDIINFNGTIYVVNGERNRVPTNKYALKYITATPDGAYQNKWDNWARPIQISDYYNAATLGASTDCGYPVIFIANNHLYVAQYDVSTTAADPLKAETRVFSEIKKVF